MLPAAIRFRTLAVLVVALSAAPSATPQVVVGGARGGGAQIEIEEIIGGLPMLAGGGTKPMETGTGLILGRVVDATDDRGVSGAIVTLSLAGFVPQRVQADTDGRFVFYSLPSGTFSISTSRPGYVDGAAGRTRPGGAPRGVTLTADERTGDVEIPMWKYAAITGTVLDENNEPLVGAQIRLLRNEWVSGRRRLSLGATDTTDDRGEYRIGNLEPGEYIVALPMIARESLDTMLAGLRDGLPAGAAGGGGGGAVFAMRVERTAAAGGSAPVVISSMDGNVPPAGTTPEGLPLTYQTEFYTGALAPSRATPVVLAAGDERTGVDFRIAPVRALTVSGVVTGPEGPVANAQLQLLPAESEGVISPIEAARTSSDANGQFTFAMVPAGQYTLRALKQPRVAPSGDDFSFTTSGGGEARIVTRAIVAGRGQAPPLPTEPTLWAEMPVGVGTQDMTGLTVALRTGLTVRGSLAFVGNAPQPTPEDRGGVSLTLEPADGLTAGLTNVVRGRVNPDGTFETMGVPAGKYVLRVSGAPQGWQLRDAVHGGRDITSVAVDLSADNAAGAIMTFVDRPTEVTGTVRDRSGNPDPAASVVIFPADSALWMDTGSNPRRLQQTRAGRDGSFTFRGLPAGDYLLLAIDDAQTANWQAPVTLSQFSRLAKQVRLVDGDTRTEALTTQRGER